MSRMRSRPHRLCLAGLSATTLLTSCTVDPAEYLVLQMLVADAYNVRRVLEQARPGQPLTVVVRVGNFGQEVVGLEVPCPFFSVRNRGGDVVGPSAASCAGTATSQVALWPGDSIRFSSQWAGEDLTGAPLPRAGYALEAWTRRVDRADSIQTGVEWVCLLPDGFPPPNASYHDCGIPGDILPSRVVTADRALSPAH